jgi:nucleotidyltransferase/DNA polymerase involved in DNA repair
MDAFLRHKSVAVLGNQGAWVIAKSYEMKSRGVQTGEPIWEALRKCPDGIYLQCPLPESPRPVRNPWQALPPCNDERERVRQPHRNGGRLQRHVHAGKIRDDVSGSCRQENADHATRLDAHAHRTSGHRCSHAAEGILKHHAL